MDMKKSLPLFLAAALMTMLAACAGPEENARPDPIEMSQFKQGTSRIDVIGAVGKPEMTLQKAGRPCDVYKLYTRGIGSGGKAALAITEGITDVATLGLAEVAWSGIHAGTRPDMHTVLFCYGQPPDDDALVDIYDKNPTVQRPATHTVVDAARYARPVIVAAGPAPAPAPLAPPQAGTISLGNVSREGSGSAGLARRPVAAGTSTDDLNTVSASTSSTANAPSMGTAPTRGN